MVLLNYTTQIKTEKTIGEIQAMLAQHGASAVLSEYDDGGNVSALSFKIQMNPGEIAFRLPARPEAVYLLLKNNRRVPSRLCTLEQAHRVTWRIIRSWVQAQMALIETKMVKLEEIFLPYAENPLTKKTLYEELEAKGLKKLLSWKPTKEIAEI